MVPRSSTEVKPSPGGDLFAHGIALFNRCAFFECHEVLEELWRPERGPRRLFLQAVIHLAVGFYHHQQGNQTGAERQLHKGLKKLAAYLPEFAGVDTEALYRESVLCQAEIAAGRKVEHFPRIVMAAE